MINTLHYVKILETVGFSRAQAEVQAQMIVDMVEGELVTKKELQAELKDLEYRLTIRLGAMMATFIALSTAVITLAVKSSH